MPESHPCGYLALVLHAHLPFVRHPEHREFLEERWLFEAISECYLPLLLRLRRLQADGVPFRLTVSLTPTLVSMLRDDLLRGRFVERLASVERLAEAEAGRRSEPEARGLASYYVDRFRELHALWDSIRGDVAGAFADLERRGFLEIMASTATHAVLPLLRAHPEAVRAQVAVGVAQHRERIGVAPRGFWLPECAYEPGIEEVLAEHDLRFFVLDTHGLERASSVPRYGVYAPIYCPNGVAAFGRDPESSRQVWSAQSGYPGDFLYRDFYRDVGFDAASADLGDTAHPDGIRAFTGLKYHRITGKGDAKEWYAPQEALDRACLHARHFLESRLAQARWLAEGMPDRPPIVVAPYDAELFGHWWYEGPDFLEALFRAMSADPSGIEPVTLAEYLRRHPVNQCATPSPSTWGSGGHHRMWLGEANSWIYRHLDRAAEEMIRVVRENESSQPRAARALRQAARELLLAQSSDWAFIMASGTSVEFAVRRVKAHLARHRRLVEGIDSWRIDERWLSDLERRDNLFPTIDHRVYR